MIGIHELNRWLIVPLLTVLLASGMVATATANQSTAPSASVSCLKERGRPPDRPIPPGQMTRRGVTGNYVGISELGNILVETQFGIVEIAAPDDFDESTLEVGSRIAALMEKEPKPVEGVPPGAETDTPFTIEPEDAATDTPFRTGTALKLKVIPTKATLSHDRGVVVTQGDGNVEVVDENGDVGDLELTGQGGDPIEDGTDAVLLTKCSASGDKAEIRNIQRADKIAERLEQFQAKFTDDPEKAAKFADLGQKRLDRLEARLAKTSNNAPPSARGNIDKARGKGAAQSNCPEDGSTTEDCPNEKGKPEDKGKPDDSGGGGNQGGGPPEGKGGGKK